MDTAWKLSPREGMDVYVLIEFQSTPVPHMALRTCTYSTLLYEAMLEQKVTSNKDPHWPPILCVVIYNGKRRWRGALGLQQRIWKPPAGSLKRYLLQHRFKLVDINKEVLENKTDDRNLVAILMRFERPQHPTDLPQLIALLNDCIPVQDELRVLFILWIGELVGKSSWLAQLAEQTLMPKEHNMDLAECAALWEQNFVNQGRRQGLLDGRQKGRQEGRQEGMLLGQAGLLEKVLRKRFGRLDRATLARLKQASGEDLQRWALRAIDASDLTEVFQV
jgi:hypothetical protein